MSDTSREEETLGATREGDNPAEKDPSDWVTGAHISASGYCRIQL